MFVIIICIAVRRICLEGHRLLRRVKAVRGSVETDVGVAAVGLAHPLVSRPTLLTRLLLPLVRRRGAQEQGLVKIKR